MARVHSPRIDIEDTSCRVHCRRSFGARAENLGFTYPLITITALEDNLKLTNIKVNKGKCKVILEPEIYFSNGMPVVTKDSFPLKINEYDTIKARVSQDCKLLRVDILTDEYEWILENKKDFFYFN